MSVWPAIASAQRAQAGARLPFRIADAGQAVAVGSVARQHLRALQAWPEALHTDAGGITLRLPAAERDDFFAMANASLRRQGLILAWRDETYAVPADDGSRVLARFERAASRFWGSLSYGAHCNGYVADAAGRPVALWIARRSATKSTDPGMLDNLIGGGVPYGQTPAETVVREGDEEAGLDAAQMHGLQPGRVLRLARDIPEGLQHEWTSVYDLALPADWRPHNRDGEVQSHTLMPLAEAFERAAAAEMTVDATLVTLDFCLRRQLLPPDQHRLLAEAAAGLWRGLAA